MIGIFKSTITISWKGTDYLGVASGTYNSSDNTAKYYYTFSSTNQFYNLFGFTINIILNSNGTRCESATIQNFSKVGANFTNIGDPKTSSFSTDLSNVYITTTNASLTNPQIYSFIANTTVCCGECDKNNNEVVDKTKYPLLTLTLSTNKQTILCSEKENAAPILTCSIFNEGNCTLFNLSTSLTDGTPLSSSLTSNTILAGETITVSKQFTAGEITETKSYTIIISGETVDGIVQTFTSNTISIDVLSCTPALTITKTSDKSVLHLKTETARYAIEIENTGNIDLYNLTLKDNGVDYSSYLITASSDDDHFKWVPGGEFKPVKGINKQYPLRPGDIITVVYEKKYLDLTCKEIKCKYKEDTKKTNSTVVTAKYVEGTEKTITASSTYSLDVMIPGVEVSYSVVKTYANNKITLTYTVEVENTGCVDLEDITFTDTVVNTNTYTDCLPSEENSIEQSNDEDYLELSITKKAYNYSTDTEVTSITAGTKIYYVYTITNSALSTVDAQVNSISDNIINLSEITLPFTVASGVTKTISTKTLTTPIGITPANSIRNRVDITGVGLSGTTEIDKLAFSLYAICKLPVSINKFNLGATLNIDSLPVGKTKTKTFTRIFDQCSYEGFIDSTLTLTGGGFVIKIPNIFKTAYGWSSNEEIEVWFDLDNIGTTYTTSEELTIPTGTWASSTLFQSIEKIWKKKNDLEAMFPMSDQWVRAQVMDYITVHLERITTSTGAIDPKVLKIPSRYAIGDSNFNKVIDPDDIIVYAVQCCNPCSICSPTYSPCECDTILKVRCINGCKVTLCEDAPDCTKYTIYANFWNIEIGMLGDTKLETKTNASLYNYLGQISAYTAAWMLMDHVKVEAQNMDGVLAMIKESTNAKMFHSRMLFLVEGIHIPSGTSAMCSENAIDFNKF